MSGGGERLRHQEAWELVPWYVNGTLEEDEAARLEDHLGRCPLCSREVAAQRALATALREAEREPPAPDARLDRLLARLDGEPEPVRPAAADAALGAGRLAWWRGTPRPARRLLAAQLAAVLLLAAGAGWLAARQVPEPPSSPTAVPPAQFRTLTQPAPAAPPAVAGDAATVRLLFVAGTGEETMRRLLLAEGGRFVAGPSPTGVYTAAFAAPAAEVDALVEWLRESPAVELAEPVRQRQDGRRGEVP